MAYRNRSLPEEEIQNYLAQAKQNPMGAPAMTSPGVPARNASQPTEVSQEQAQAQAAKAQREAARAQDEAARQAESQAKATAKQAEAMQARNVRSWRAAGAEIVPGTETADGKPTVAQHPDGSFKSVPGPIGQPQQVDTLTDNPASLSPMMGQAEGGAADTMGGTTQAVFQQLVRGDKFNPSWVDPDSKTNKDTGVQYVESIDPATGQKVKQAVGVDTKARDTAMQEADLKLRGQEIDLRENQLKQAKMQFHPQWEPVKKDFDKLGKEVNDYPPTFRRNATGKMEKIDPKTDSAIPHDWRELTVWQKGKTDLETQYATAKAAHDKMFPYAENLNKAERDAAEQKAKLEEDRILAASGLPRPDPVEELFASSPDGKVSFEDYAAAVWKDVGVTNPTPEQIQQVVDDQRKTQQAKQEEEDKANGVNPFTRKLAEMDIEAVRVQRDLSTAAITPEEADRKTQMLAEIKNQTIAQAKADAKARLDEQGREIAASIIGTGNSAARLAGTKPDSMYQGVMGDMDEVASRERKVSDALDMAGGDIDQAISSLEKPKEQMGALEAFGIPFMGSSKKAVNPQDAAAAGQLRKMKDAMDKAGIDPKDRPRIIKDTAKMTAWTQNATDNIRKLDAGDLVMNPGRVFGQKDALIAEINASDATPEQKQSALKRLDAMRKVMAEKTHATILAGEKAKNETIGGMQGQAKDLKGESLFKQGYEKHVAEKAKEGITDKVALIDSYMAEKDSRWMISKLDDAITTGIASGAVGIGKTFIGTGAGLSALVGLKGIAASIGMKQQAMGVTASQIDEAGKMRGLTGGYGIATNLANTVTQMAPMIVGGLAAQGVKGLAQVVTQGVSVYGWAFGQGYESKLSDALDMETAKIGRPLNEKEVAGVLGRTETQVAGFLNAAQTAILAAAFPRGSEAGALGKVSANMTVGDFLRKGGMRAIKDGTLRQEIKAIGKNIFEDAKDEVLEEFSNQVLDGMISMGVLGQKMQLGTFLEQSFKAGALGGVVGGAMPQFYKGRSKQDQHAELSATLVQQHLGVPDPNIVTAALHTIDPQAKAPEAKEIKQARQLVQPSTESIKQIEERRAAYDAAIKAKDYKGAAAIDQEINDAFTQAQTSNAQDMADAVMLTRELGSLEQQGKESLWQADEALTAAKMTGDKMAIAQAEANLEQVEKSAPKVPLVRAAVKLGTGQPATTLIDSEQRALGIIVDPSGKITPRPPKDLAAEGLVKPLAVEAADGSAVILDEAVETVAQTSGMAVNRIKLGEQEAMQAAQARADAAKQSTTSTNTPTNESNTQGQSQGLPPSQAAQSAPADPNAPGGSIPDGSGSAANAGGTGIQATPEEVASYAAADAGIYTAARESNKALPSIPDVVAAARAAGQPVSPSMAQFADEQAQSQPAAANGQSAPQVAESAPKAMAERIKSRVESSLPGLKGRVNIIDKAERQSGGVIANADGTVSLVLSDIEAQLGMFDAQAVEDSISAIVSEHEVTHVVQFEAVRKAWEEAGGEKNGSFNKFWNEWYGKIGDEIAPEVFDEASKIYGAADWDAIPTKANKAAELVRMLVEASRPDADKGRFSELMRALSLKQSPTLIDTIRRAVKILVDMVKSGKLSEAVRQHVEAISALYDQMLAAQPEIPEISDDMADSLKVTREAINDALKKNKAVKENDDLRIALDDAATDLAEVMAGMPANERRAFIDSTIADWLEANAASIQKSTEDAKQADQDEGKPATAKEKAKAAREAYQAKIRAKAREIINSGDFSALSSISERGTIKPKPNAIALILARKKAGKKLTEKEMRLLRNVSEWDGVPRKQDYPGGGNNAVVRAILDMIFDPDGLMPDIIADNLTAGVTTSSEMWGAVYRELKSISRGTALVGEDPDMMETPENIAKAEAAMAAMQQEEDIQPPPPTLDDAHLYAVEAFGPEAPISQKIEAIANYSDRFSREDMPVVRSIIAAEFARHAQGLSIPEWEAANPGAFTGPAEAMLKFMRANTPESLRKNLETLPVVDRGSALYSSAPTQSPFYSQLMRTLEEKMPKSAPIAQVMQIAQSGAKAEEIKWSGLVQALQGMAVDGKVSKDAVLKYLADEGSVRFEEVNITGQRFKVTDGMLSEKYATREEAEEAADSWINNVLMDSDMPDVIQPAQLWTIEEGEDYPGSTAWFVYDFDNNPVKSFDEKEDAEEYLDDYKNLWFIKKEDVYSEADSYPKRDGYDTEAEAIEARDEEARSNTGVEVNELDTSDSAKFASYTLPGGENYKEIVLAMPKRRNHVGNPFGNYTSSHFPDVPNYVAHMRTNERTDAEGKPGLFVEELQSDRHQAGRKKGYAGESGRMWSIYNKDGIQLGTGEGATAEEGLAYWKRIAGSVAPQGIDVRPQLSTGISDAPFRTTWPLALFKRALRDAVASGKDWIGWTVGETQNDRFDLSKQVDTVHVTDWEESGDDMVKLVAQQNGKNVIEEVIHRSKLPDYIGKDVSDRIMAAPVERGSRTLRGEQLKVGGSGMKGFYDNMLPKEIGKYVKQWGGSVQASKLSGTGSDLSVRRDMTTGRYFLEADMKDGRIPSTQYDTEAEAISAKSTPIWRIDITPQMKAGVEAGQALFSSAPQDNQGNFKSIRKTISQFSKPASEYQYENAPDHRPEIKSAVEQLTQLTQRKAESVVLRELSDQLAEIERETGATIGFFRSSAELTIFGFTPIAQPSLILINAGRGDLPMASTIVHELVHIAQKDSRTDAPSVLKTIFDHLTEGQIGAISNALMDEGYTYKSLTAEIPAFVVADAVTGHNTIGLPHYQRGEELREVLTKWFYGLPKLNPDARPGRRFADFSQGGFDFGAPLDAGTKDQKGLNFGSLPPGPNAKFNENTTKAYAAAPEGSKAREEIAKLSAKRNAGKTLTADEEDKLLKAEAALGQKLAFDMEAVKGGTITPEIRRDAELLSMIAAKEEIENYVFTEEERKLRPELMDRLKKSGLPIEKIHRLYQGESVKAVLADNSFDMPEPPAAFPPVFGQNRRDTQDEMSRAGEIDRSGQINLLSSQPAFRDVTGIASKLSKPPNQYEYTEHIEERPEVKSYLDATGYKTGYNPASDIADIRAIEGISGTSIVFVKGPAKLSLGSNNTAFPRVISINTEYPMASVGYAIVHELVHVAQKDSGANTLALLKIMNSMTSVDDRASVFNRLKELGYENADSVMLASEFQAFLLADAVIGTNYVGLDNMSQAAPLKAVLKGFFESLPKLNPDNRIDQLFSTGTKPVELFSSAVHWPRNLYAYDYRTEANRGDVQHIVRTYNEKSGLKEDRKFDTYADAKEEMDRLDDLASPVLFSSSPEDDPFQMALSKMPPIYSEVFHAVESGMTPEEVSTKFNIPPIGVTNILKQVRSRVVIAAKAQAGTLTPKTDENGKFVNGRPKLAEGANPDFVAVDQNRKESGIPDVISMEENYAEADRRLAADYEGEFARLENMAKEGQGPDRIDIAIAKQIFRRETLSGGLADPQRRARVALFRVAYREQGTEQGRAFQMRRDEALTPAQRNALHLTELLYEPSPQVQERMKGADAETREAILKKWMDQIDAFKAEMKADGVDIEASLAAWHAHKQAVEKAEQIHAGTKTAMDEAFMKLSKMEKTVIRLIRDGAKLSTVMRQSGMTKEEVMDVKHRFGMSWKQAIIDAGKKFAANSLASSAPQDIYDMVMTDLGWQSDSDFDDTAPDYFEKQDQKRKDAKKKTKEPAPKAPKIAKLTAKQQEALDAAWDRFKAAQLSTWVTLFQIEEKNLAPMVGQTAFEQWKGEVLKPWRDLWQTEMDAITDPAGRITFDQWISKPRTTWTAKQSDLFEKTRQPINEIQGTFDINDPVMMSKIANDWARKNGNWVKKTIEWFKMSILSGFQTAIRNTTGGFHIIYELGPRRIVEASWNDLLKVFGGGDVRGATLSEIIPMMKQTRAAIIRGATNAVSSWKLESPVFDNYASAKPIQLDFIGLGSDRTPPALNTATWKELKSDPSFLKSIHFLNGFMRNITFRELTAVDEFWSGIHAHMNATAIAHRIAAKEEKLTGDAYTKRMEELTKPGSAAWIRTIPETRSAVFQAPLAYGKFTKEDEKRNSAHQEGMTMTWEQAAKKSETQSIVTLMDAVAAGFMQARKFPFIGPLLEVLALPFILTPKNLVQKGIEVTPIGLMIDIIDGMRSLRRRLHAGQITKEESNRIAGELYNQARFVQTLTNQTMGMMILYAVAGLMDDDDEDKYGRPNLTGTKPYASTKKGDRDNSEAVMPEQSIRIGDMVFSYRGIEPIATALSFYADLSLSFKRNGTVNTQLVSDTYTGLLNQMENKLFLKGIGDLLTAARHPERAADRLAAGWITGFVPNIVRQPIRETDPWMRDTKPSADVGFFDAVGRRVGYSIVPKWAPQKFSIWGKPIPSARGELLGGSTIADSLFRVFDPLNVRFGGKINPIDSWVFHYNMAQPDSSLRIGIESPDDIVQIHIPGEPKPRNVYLTAAEHEESIKNIGQAAAEYLSGMDWDWKTAKKPDAYDKAQMIKATFTKLKTMETKRLKVEKFEQAMKMPEKK